MAKIKYGVFITGLQLDTTYKLEDSVIWLYIPYHPRQINEGFLGFTVTDTIMISNPGLKSVCLVSFLPRISRSIPLSGEPYFLCKWNIFLKIYFHSKTGEL